MYRAILTASLCLTPALAVAVAVAAPTCAAPPPSQSPSDVLSTVQSTNGNPLNGPRPAAAVDARAIPADVISRVPALQRISSTGAHLTDLGTEHGLRTVFAHNGKSFQVFYITPDGQGAVGGVMWDHLGHNITRDQVAEIPGVIPTVTIGRLPTTPGAVASNDLSPLDIEALAQTTYGLTGSASAPRLWMFIDPLCSFSIRAMEQLKPAIAAGKLEVAVIPLSLLDYEDKGQSTVAAKIMLSQSPDHMVSAWTTNTLSGEPSPASSAILQANMAAQNAAKIRGTPTFFWNKPDGSVGQQVGMPADLDAMIASIAPKAT